MRKLIINTTNNEIINDLELSMGEEPTNLLASWANTNGEIVYPTGYASVDYDGEYAFNDENIAGYLNKYYYIDNTVTLVRVAKKELVSKEIDRLTIKLQESDYKIIKAYEASLVNGAVTYDFEEVHAERQQYRDKINELQELMNNISND